MIYSSNRLAGQLSTAGLGGVIQPETESRRRSAYPRPSAKSALSPDCKRSRHSHCFKLTCGCKCHEDEAV